MIAESEGERQSKINRRKASPAGDRFRGRARPPHNEAEGKAKEILLVAEAQAAGITKVAESLNVNGCIEFVNMQLAHHYLTQFGNLAKTNNSMIVPADLSNVAGILQACTSIIKKS